MPEPMLAFAIFDRILSVIGLIREDRKTSREDKDKALTALCDALAETKAYLAEREAGAERNHSREFEIARLWQAAAIPLRHFDEEFADRCFIKGGYWMEPDVWSSEEIEAKGIAIDQVMAETRELLHG